MALPVWISRSLGGARSSLLEELQQQPTTVDRLAAQLGLPSHAVRGHLAVLERDGFVERIALRRATRGKPAYEYRIATAAAVHLSSAYAAAILHLVGAMRQRLPPADVSALLRAAGRQLAPRSRTMDARPRSRIEEAAEAFTALGGTAEIIERPQVVTLTSQCCPLATITSEHAGGCDLLEAFVSEIANAPVRQRCTHDGGMRCVFEIGREQAAPDASGHSGE